MRAIHKKIAVGVVAGTVVLAGSGVALAVWSASGSGTGSAGAAAGASNLVITQTSAPANLAPGVAAGSITGTVKNNASNSAFVASVTVGIVSVTGPNIAPSTPCDASDFDLSNPTMTVAQDVAAGASVSFSGATLGFHNKATNQDGCKGATVNLGYTAS